MNIKKNMSTLMHLNALISLALCMFLWSPHVDANQPYDQGLPISSCLIEQITHNICPRALPFAGYGPANWEGAVQQECEFFGANFGKGRPQPCPCDGPPCSSVSSCSIDVKIQPNGGGNWESGTWSGSFIDNVTGESWSVSEKRGPQCNCPQGAVFNEDGDDCRCHRDTPNWDAKANRCVSGCPKGLEPVEGVCPEEDDADKNDGDDCNNAGNPCNVATGNKYQAETDFSIGGFTFTRSYNSQNLADLGLRTGWRHSFQRKLVVSDNQIVQISATGRGEPWLKQDDIWLGDADSDVLLSETAAGFQLSLPNGVIEQYSHTGLILSSTQPDGEQTHYRYNGIRQLTEVNNTYGYTIQFEYDRGRLVKVTDPAGAEYRYQYANQNLMAVVFPDTTPEDDSDNPRKTYHYENTAFPHHLTGISDENGERYATYVYDLNGKAISTEHAQTSNSVGQERIELDYQTGGTP